PPAPAWLAGTWHVTHSTLPMWRSKRNVRITYTPLPETSPPQLDDLVEYQPQHSAHVKTVRGVDKPAADGAGWAWDWRGRGWLVVATSRWEVLGFGDEAVDSAGVADAAVDGNSWAVTYFAKTLFTPAGIDVYSRRPGGVRPDTLHQIKTQLAGFEDEGMQRLARELFEVQGD
ncbi:uncharacterized protein K452DRAFT_210544, partial [Aplosporella prunicola CBS 121167]